MSQGQHKKIGVRVDDLQAGVKSGLRIASQLGFAAAEIAVDTHEVCPAELSESGRRHLARLVRSGSMDFTGLAQGSKGADLCNMQALDQAMDATRDAIRLASDMRVPILSKNLGPIWLLNETDRATVISALQEVSQHADRMGVVLAMRSRFGGAQSLTDLVRQIACPGLKLALDPGELISAGIDPLAVAGGAGEQLGIAYVRDAQSGTAEHAGAEVALGQGDLDLHAYLAQLSIHQGIPAPILRRIHSGDAASDIAADRQTLIDAMLF